MHFKFKISDEKMSYKAYLRQNYENKTNAVIRFRRKSIRRKNKQ